MTLFRRLFVAALLLIAPCLAQSKTAVPGGFKLDGDIDYRANTVRLTRNARGLAHIQSPQLDVRAQVIAFDQNGKTVSEVRAVRGVILKLSVTPRGSKTPIRVEATCDDAVLTPRPFKLVLTGHLNGFYQVEDGPKTTLRGEKATLTSPDGNILADLLGGTQGVSITVPAENLTSPATPSATPKAPPTKEQQERIQKRLDAIGEVTLTAQRAQINESDGTATLIGQAHAVSTGTNAFDVSAQQFVLKRAADGTIATLQTSGRTFVKLDFPPDQPLDPPSASGATPTPTPVAGTAAGTAAKPTLAQQIGQPTHVEVASDSALITRATSTATFDGHVKGFYRLTPATGESQNYDFTGDKATIRYVVPPDAGAAGGNALARLSVQISDASVDAPAFNFGF